MVTPPDTHVVLLRGINVGGHHKVPMQELRACLVQAGCRDVQTYIQSGNAVVRAPDRPDLAAHLSAAIEARFGFPVPVVTRPAADFLALARRPHPLWVEGADDKLLFVGFLADRPDPARVAALDPDRSPGDRFRVEGREILLHFPGGSARSKLTNDWFDRQLGVLGTWRNWRTVQALAELVEAG